MLERGLIVDNLDVHTIVLNNVSNNLVIFIAMHADACTLDLRLPWYDMHTRH